MLCTLGRSTTKQNSHYLPGCTWKGADSTRQRVRRKNAPPDKNKDKIKDLAATADLHQRYAR